MRRKMKTRIVFVVLLTTTILSPRVYGQSGSNWTLYNSSPVFSNSEGDDWDRAMVAAPMVVMVKDTLRMWYEGSSTGFSGEVNIGYAWSLDGIAWNRKTDGPVLSARNGEWDYPHVGTPSVIVDGDTLRMWYGGGRFTGTGLQIGYAWSLDGIDWNRISDPVSVTKRSWSQDGVIPGGVIKENGVFKMWFNGGIGPVANPLPSSRWSVGLATSSDGIHWTSSDEPVLQHGTNGDFDRDNALCGTVMKTSTSYEMWYSGSYKDGGSSRSSIGYATSLDGITWEKHESNPVLSFQPAESKSGNASSLGDAFYSPHVVFDGSKYNMWFAAWHPGPTIGYAISDLVTGAEDDLLTSIPEESRLFQNYPNPFHSFTTIEYQIPDFSHVSLVVYDLLGNSLARLVNTYQQGGTYRIEFDAKGLSSGHYFIRLWADGNSKTISIISVK
jgi:predicted GH43/DUF377 family glycosyl hydrolase